MTSPEGKPLNESPDIQTSIELPSGQIYLFNKKLEREDMHKISEIWSTVRTDEILRIEQDAVHKIIQYLLTQGYQLVALEKMKLV